MAARFLILFCFCLAAVYTQAQNQLPVTIKADKNKILIGEPLLLTVEVNLPAESSLSVLQPDTLEHFEFLSAPVMDSIKSEQGIQLKRDYRITSFDSGRWVIPAASFVKGVKEGDITVEVVFSEFNPAQDYHDIKDIAEVKPPRKKIPWWWIACTGLVLVGLSFFLLRKKSPASKPVVVVPVSDPYKETMSSLSALKQKNISGKQYYTELVNIFRLYVYRKKGILSLQKTTEDLILQLRSQQMPSDIYEAMAQALRMSDYIKFAKYTASAEDDEDCFVYIKKAIDSIQYQETKE